MMCSQGEAKSDSLSALLRKGRGATLWSLVVEESEMEMLYSSPGNPILSIEDESSIPPAETEHPYILAVDDDQSILSMLMSLLGSEADSCVCFVEGPWDLPFLQEIDN